MSAPELQRGSPYQGLIPYDEADAPFFFGREKEARLIIANLFASPLTLLYGASGVGKSSVLRAGVARQLRAREELLVVVFNAWQSNPLVDLKNKIAEAAGRLNVRLEVPSDSTHLSDFLANCAAQLDRRLMIILDQFEEYFLYHPQEDEFAAEFSRAVTQSGTPISFLISIREDFYAKLDRFEGRIPTLYDNYLRIEHLDRKAARVAIEKPITEYNRQYTTNGHFSIEPELVDTVLRQVETGRVIIGEAGRGVIEAAGTAEQGSARIETPFLQLVMTRLWEKELGDRSNKLRLKTLNDLGGAENIVRTHLDAVVTKLSARDQEIAAGMFHYLVTPSGTKIAYTASDLAGSAELSEAEAVRVLDTLSHGDVRILRTVEPSPDRPGAPRYEIFHDVLAPAILSWRTAYVQAQDRADAERRAEEQKKRADEQARVAKRLRRLSVALAVVALLALASTVYAIQQRRQAQAFFSEAKTERERAQNQAELAKQRGIAAEKAELAAKDAQTVAVAAEKRADTSRQETEAQIKIAEQRKAEAEQAQNVARVSTAAAAAAKAEAHRMTITANEQARAASVGYANLLAEQSRAVGDTYPQRSLLLALEALNQTRPDDPSVPAAEGALRQALSQVGGRVFIGHEAAVAGVAISPDNRWLVSVDEGGRAYLWDVNAGDSAAPRHLPGVTNPLVFSKDNRWLVTGSHDPETKQAKTVALLWDVNNPTAPPQNLSGHSERIDTVIFSANKQWLVTGSSKRDLFQSAKVTARVWDLASNPIAKPASLPGESNAIIAVSSDNRWLVSDGRDPNNKEGKSVSLWDMNGANPFAKSFVLRGHTGQVTRAVFSRDGHWLATAGSNCSYGNDPSVRVWDLTAADPGSSSRELKGGTRFTPGLAFSLDGNSLVAGGDGTGEDACGEDPNSYLWNLTQSAPLPANLGNIGKPVAFIPVENVEVIVTQPSEYKARLYLLDNNSAKQVVDLRGALVAHSSDHRQFVTMNADWLEDISSMAALMAGKTPQYKPLQFWSFSRLLIGATDPLMLRGHEGSVSAAVFSEDNRFLVTGGKDKSVRLWSLTSSLYAAPLSISAFDDGAFHGANGRWLITHDSDHTVNAWDLAAADPTARPLLLRGHEGDTSASAVSPDDRWLATSSKDGTLRIWDLTAINPSASPKIIRASASDIAFSSDARRLATLSFGNETTVSMWDLSVDPSSPTSWTVDFSRDRVYLSPDYRWLIDFDRGRAWDMGARNLNLKSMNLDKARLTISPDGEWLVSKTNDSARLHSLRDRDSAAKVYDLKQANEPFVFSPTGRLLFTNDGSKVSLWNLDDPGAPPQLLPTKVEIRIEAVSFSPDGHWLAARGGNSDFALLWNLRSPRADALVLSGSNSPTRSKVTAMEFSADSRWLMTSDLATVTLWDLAAENPSGASVAIPVRGIIGEVTFTSQRANRQWLLVSTGGGDFPFAVSLWNMQRQELGGQACRTAGRNLTEAEWKEYFPNRPYRKTCPDFPGQ